jgi:hypothetical protein
MEGVDCVFGGFVLKIRFWKVVAEPSSNQKLTPVGSKA